jgi:hypothetical protein
MTLPAPYAPLVSGGEGLERYPADPAALAARMAQIYGAPVEQVLPVRGLTHGLELVWRLAAREGRSVQAPDAQPYAGLAAIYPGKGETAAVVIRALGSPEAVAEMAERVAPALLVVDEGLIEFADGASAVTAIGDHANLVVLRSLSLAYGLAGARVGAADGAAADAGSAVVGAGALCPARTFGPAGTAGAGPVADDRDRRPHRFGQAGARPRRPRGRAADDGRKRRRPHPDGPPFRS